MKEITWESISNIRASSWSITIQGPHLVLTALQTRLNKLQYSGYRVIEHFENLTDEEVQEALFDFQTDLRVRGGQAYLGIPRDLVEVVISDFPNEARVSLEETIGYQLPSLFPGNLEEFDFFHQIIGESEQLKVMILAVKKEVMGQAFAYIRKWNLKLSGITMDTFGLINGLSKSNRQIFTEDRIAVFNFRAKGMELIGLNEGRLTASEYFEHDEDWDPSTLIEDLEEGFSLSRLDPNEVDRFLFTGNPTEEMRRWLSEEVGIVPAKWHDAQGKEVDDRALIGFGVAASFFSDKQSLTLNMLPERLRRTKRQWPLWLAAILTVIVLAYFMVKETKAYRELRTEQAQLTERLSQINGRLLELSDLRSGMDKKQAEGELYKNYRAENMFFQLLYQLSQQLPDHTFLTGLQIRNHTELTISGESDEALQIERLLSGMPFLTDVKQAMAISTSRGNEGKQRFSYKATIKLEALR